MNKLVILKKTDLKKYVKKRAGHQKLGDQVKLLTDSTPIYDQLISLDVQFVLFGIPEDIGSFANNGRIGTYNSYNQILKSLLNTESNAFNQGENLVVLGHLDFSEEQNKILNFNPNKASDRKKARSMVAEMDTYVTKLIHDIVLAGKIPIVIGGGHNNAYGNIKGTALALDQSINAINLDAHVDFDPEEGRHNGNGFTYAFNEKFLHNYFVLGYHENYVTKRALNTIKKQTKRIALISYESLYVRRERIFKNECRHALKFIGNKPFGIEIDCDAVENISCIAMTPTGITVKKAREFVHFFGKHKQATYLHVAGAAPDLASKKTAKLTSKFVSYLITDFMRAKGAKKV